MSKPLAVIIDDQEMDRKILQLSMKRFDIDSLATSDPKEFLEWIKTKKPQLCFVDLHMGGRNMGYALIQSIRSVLGHRPVLFMVSGSQDPITIAHSIEIGANDYLIKPLNLNVLATKVARYVQNDAINDFEADFIPWAGEEIRAQAVFEGDIEMVDEFGITLRSPHLISKGAAIRLEGELIEKMTGKSEGVLMTVSRNRFDDQTKMAQCYAEFDILDEILLTHVRQWLIQTDR